MRIRLLGTAAGGGVPQWNCNCPACREARAGTGRVTPRTQSAVAISADDKRWFLLNASPDIRSQIENFPPLHPPARETRGSPIEGVLLTNADLDQIAGGVGSAFHSANQTASGGFFLNSVYDTVYHTVTPFYANQSTYSSSVAI